MQILKLLFHLWKSSAAVIIVSVTLELAVLKANQTTSSQFVIKIDFFDVINVFVEQL